MNSVNKPQTLEEYLKRIYQKQKEYRSQPEVKERLRVRDRNVKYFLYHTNEEYREKRKESSRSYYQKKKEKLIEDKITNMWHKLWD